MRFASVLTLLLALASPAVGRDDTSAPVRVPSLHDLDSRYRSPVVTALAFSPDGKHLVASYFVPPVNRPGTDWDTWVTQFDLETGKRVTVDRATSPILFSRSGKLAMAVQKRGGDRGLRHVVEKCLALWELGKQEPYRILERPTSREGGAEPIDNSVAAATFAYSGSRLVSMNSSGEVVLWELEDDQPPLLLGKVLPTILGVEPSVAFSPVGMGNILAISPRAGRRRARGGEKSAPPERVIWSAKDAARRRFEARVSRIGAAPPNSLNDHSWFFSSSPLTLPLASLEGLTAEHDLSPGSRVLRSGPRYVRVVQGNLNGKKLYAYGGAGKLAVLSGIPDAPLRYLPFGSSAIAFSRDGKRLASGVARGVIRIWDVERERFAKTLRLDDRVADTFRVAAIQAASVLGAPKKNRKELERLVRRAAFGGAKIVVLPEASISGYVSQDLKRTWRIEGRKVTDGLTGVDPAGVAESVPGMSTQHFRRLARELGIYLTTPLLEVDRKSGRHYNTVVLLDPHGRQVIHYRKRNPWPWAERGWATDGDLGNPIVDTPYGRLSVLVCFDIHEQAKVLRDLKVDTLLYSIAWVDDEDSNWFDARLPRVASEHGLNIVGANWTVSNPEKPDWHGYGKTRIIARNGKILAKAKDDLKPEIVYADLPLPR